MKHVILLINFIFRDLFITLYLQIIMHKDDEDVHSFVVCMSKPGAYSTKMEDKSEKCSISKRNKTRLVSKLIIKPSDQSLKKYSMPGVNPLPVDVLKKEELVLPYKIFVKKEKHDRYKKYLSINIFDKYKIDNTDLRKRLNIDQPPDDVKAIADIDKEFYNYMNGRPLPHSNIPLYKSLKTLLSNLLRVRQEIGYIKDTAINIDVVQRKELETYDFSLKRCIDQAKYFDGFIFEDYQNSMHFLERLEILEKKLNFQMAELQSFATQKITIMSRLIGLDYMYDIQQKYGRFLYYLSPPSWRSKNRDFAQSVEIEAKGFDFGSSNEEDTFAEIFAKLRNECLEKNVKPVLYFRKPDELISVFEAIEKHQLNHFTHVTHMTPHARMLKDGIKYVKETIVRDSAILKNAINNFETLLEFYEERSRQLQDRFFSIVNGLFYESVGTQEVLKLMLHLEFGFEQVYREKPINMDLIAVAKGLEKLYMEYMKKLDSVHNSTVKLAVSRCIEEQKRKIRRAHIATKELRLFDRLERELIRSYATYRLTAQINAKKHTKKKKTKSKCTKSKVEEKPTHVLTEAEIEYLTLFTSWTKTDDPAKFLLSFDLDEREVIVKNISNN